MNKKDPIASLFEKLQTDFDFELPKDGHQERFSNQKVWLVFQKRKQLGGNH